MKLVICCATMHIGSAYPGDTALAVSNSDWRCNLAIRYNTPEDNLGVVGSYQYLYEQTKEDILCYLHDDVIIRERDWDLRVLKEFEDPRVGIVGFGGATWHGVPDLYKIPYELHQLRRGGYMSNVDDAEVHGARFTGSKDVVVLDGFCLIVRRDVLDRCGGFSCIREGCDFFCYDYALCAIARRLGYSIRVLGVRCHHRGGGTSVGAKVKEITSPEAYDSSHKWFYNNFRDVMPARVHG